MRVCLFVRYLLFLESSFSFLFLFASVFLLISLVCLCVYKYMAMFMFVCLSVCICLSVFFSEFTCFFLLLSSFFLFDYFCYICQSVCLCLSVCVYLISQSLSFSVYLLIYIYLSTLFPCIHPSLKKSCIISHFNEPLIPNAFFYNSFAIHFYLLSSSIFFFLLLRINIQFLAALLMDVGVRACVRGGGRNRNVRGSNY